MSLFWVGEAGCAVYTCITYGEDYVYLSSLNRFGNWRLKRLGNLLTVTQFKFEFRSEVKAWAFNGCTFLLLHPLGNDWISIISYRKCVQQTHVGIGQWVVCTLSQKQGSECGMSKAEAKKDWMELETRCGVGQTEIRSQRSWQVETIGWGTMMNPDVAAR